MSPQIRKKIEAFILKYVNMVDESGTNGDMYKKVFKVMSDKDLDSLIAKPIPIYAPNGGPVKIDHMRNIEILRELGYEPEQHCWITDPKTGVCSKTKYKHLVLRLPVRRQTQMIDKKVSLAEHNRSIDTVTGQTVGSSKGSSFSFPQIYTMYSKGYDHTIQEFINCRGGNEKAFKAIDRNIRQTGHSSQNFEGKHLTRVKSTVSLSRIFAAMHLNFNKGGPNGAARA